MEKSLSKSDLLEERLIEFAAAIIQFSSELPKNAPARHVASQMLRSGTAAAPNYAEARGAESRADFVHKLGIVQKELNETSVWIRVVMKSFRRNDDLIVALLRENTELARIIAASVRTTKERSVLK